MVASGLDNEFTEPPSLSRVCCSESEWEIGPPPRVASWKREALPGFSMLRQRRLGSGVSKVFNYSRPCCM